MIRFLGSLVLMAITANAVGEETQHVAMAERFEYRESSEDLLWDLQGWHGGDYNKFWWKTEGDFADGSIEEGEFQLLYSRAWTAWFDWQAGYRYAEVNDQQVHSAVLGIQGFARYRFETDIGVFFTEDGDVLARAEFERDILFSQKLILQPRAEFNLALDDIPELGIGSGLYDVAIEARLRYEFTRKFAPYLGVSWQASFGNTADFLRATGGDDQDTTIVAGLRFWF